MPQGLTVKENANLNSLDRRANDGLVARQEVQNFEMASKVAADSTPRVASWRQRMWRTVAMIVMAVAVVGAGVAATPEFNRDAAQHFFGNATLLDTLNVVEHYSFVVGDVARNFFGDSLLFCCMAGGAIAEATKIVLEHATRHSQPVFDAALKQLAAYDTNGYMDMVGYFDGVGYFHASFTLYYGALGAFGIAVLLGVQAHLYTKARRA